MIVVPDHADRFDQTRPCGRLGSIPVLAQPFEINRRNETMQLARVPALAADLGPDWCVDTDTRDTVMARRNVLTGLWAGRMLGLSGDALTSYARTIHAADFRIAGDDDIVAHVTNDLNANGIAVTTRAVRNKLAEFRRQALMETAVTD
jgi:hypothetical protein